MVPLTLGNEIMNLPTQKMVDTDYATLAALINKVDSPPCVYDGKIIDSEKAVSILLSDDTLLSQRFCTDNPELCDTQDLWKVLFHLKFPELYPLFLEVSVPFTSKGKRGIMVGVTSVSRKPLFWRDCYLDLQNMPYSMTKQVEMLMNGDIALESSEVSFWGEHAYLEKTLAELFQSFWTVGIVLANLDATRHVVAPALVMIEGGHLLLPYVLFPHEVFTNSALEALFTNRASKALMTELRVFDTEEQRERVLRRVFNMKEASFLYLMKNYFALSPEQVLYYSALNGHMDTIRYLLDPESLIPWDQRTMCLASHGRRITKGLRPVDSWLQRAITLASSGGHAEVLRLLLLDKEVTPNANDHEALQMASFHGHGEIVQILLSDPRFVHSANTTPFLVACKRGHSEIVLLLLDSVGADFTSAYDIAMVDAVTRGHSEVVQILLQRGCDVQSTTEWYRYRWFRNAGVARILLDGGKLDPAAHGNEAIHQASSRGLTEVVRILLADPRVDPASRDNRAIRLASLKGHPEVIKLLLADPRVDPAAASNDAIQNAVQCTLICRDGPIKEKYVEIIILLAEYPVLESKEDYEILPRTILKRIVRRKGLEIDASMRKSDLLYKLFSDGKAQPGEKLTMKELRKLSTEKNIRGGTKMNKEELMQALFWEERDHALSKSS